MDMLETVGLHYAYMAREMAEGKALTLQIPYSERWSLLTHLYDAAIKNETEGYVHTGYAARALLDLLREQVRDQENEIKESAA